PFCSLLIERTVLVDHFLIGVGEELEGQAVLGAKLLVAVQSGLQRPVRRRAAAGPRGRRTGRRHGARVWHDLADNGKPLYPDGGARCLPHSRHTDLPPTAQWARSFRCRLPMGMAS